MQQIKRLLQTILILAFILGLPIEYTFYWIRWIFSGKECPKRPFFLILYTNL